MSSVAVNPPKTPVTKGSNGLATATLPNVCKMPGPPAPFVPTPLPNIGKSGDSPQGYSTTVKIEGQPVGIQGASFGSMGDVASKGTGGGIVSNNVEGPTKFLAPGSLNVKIEGKNVQYLGDQMLNNCGPGGSPANSATMTGEVQQCLIASGDPGNDDACANAKKEKKRACTSIPSLMKGKKVIENFENQKMVAHITCEEISARIKGFDDCLAARQEVTRLCFGGILDFGDPNGRHVKEEAALARGKDKMIKLGKTTSTARPKGCW